MMDHVTAPRSTRVALLGGGAVAACCLAIGAAGAAGAAPPECQSVAMPDGKSVRMCRGANGHWIAADRGKAVQPLAAALPTKASVTFSGTYQFTLAPKRSIRRTQPTLSLASLLGVKTQPEGMRYEGAITIVATFDGPAVTASISGTGGLKTVRVSGLVRDGTCRLVDGRGAEVYEGRCDTAGFSGSLMSTPNSRQSFTGDFETSVASLVDVAQRDAKAAVEKGVVDARKATLKKQCDAGKLTACVEYDTLR